MGLRFRKSIKIAPGVKLNLGSKSAGISTTISKMRIFDPRNLKGVLAGISLSEENMEKINQKMKELYIF